MDPLLQEKNYLPEEEEEEAPEPNKTWEVIRIITSLIVIGGLLYISGIEQYFFYKRTPESVQEKSVESILDAEAISLSVAVFVLRNENNGSERSSENVRNLVSNASRIWEQANIMLNIVSLSELEVNDEELGLLLRSPSAFLDIVDQYAEKNTKAFLTKRLGGINGIAFLGLRTIAVADLTTVYDFRVFAHEIGHILGLGHVDGDRGRLMYRGANGIKFSVEEIIRARKTVEELSTQI